MTEILSGTLQQSLDYRSYRKLLDSLMSEEKTTGENQDDWLVDYAKLNIHRMNRLDKTWKPAESLEQRLLAIESSLTFLTITEGWCGDAAQIVPIIELMANTNPMITHRLVLRDEHPELMDQFLTNGTRSIPKTIIIDNATAKVLGSWGPRPTGAAALLKALKLQSGLPKEEQYNQLHGWYAKDKGEQTATEFLDAVEQGLKNQANRL